MSSYAEWREWLGQARQAAIVALPESSIWGGAITSLLIGLLLVATAPCLGKEVTGGLGLRVGAAGVELEADDSMIIAGGIAPGKASGQEGKLRAVAVVLQKGASGKLAIVACDILMMTRQWLDPVVAEIEKTTGIPAASVLINCTHTHHAPSTVILHGYG
ncbi:MAG: hypothetical protein DME25_01030, partial [Verrucomicrobia bacterium]